MFNWCWWFQLLLSTHYTLHLYLNWKSLWIGYCQKVQFLLNNYILQVASTPHLHSCTNEILKVFQLWWEKKKKNQLFLPFTSKMPTSFWTRYNTIQYFLQGWTYGLNGALRKATRISGIQDFIVNVCCLYLHKCLLSC